MRELCLENFDGEVWLDVADYAGVFQVSNLGRFKRLASNTLKWNKSKLGKPFLHNTKVTEKIFKQQTDRRGYLRVKTQVDGDTVNFIVHREVAKVFLPNPENKRCVNHKDGVKCNNKLSNLEWVTDQENLVHSYVTGLHKAKTGEESIRFSGAVDAYDKETNEFICRMYGNIDMKTKGFDFRLVSAVLKGKRKSHNGCTFIKIKLGD